MNLHFPIAFVLVFVLFGIPDAPVSNLLDVGGEAHATGCGTYNSVDPMNPDLEGQGCGPEGTTNYCVGPDRFFSTVAAAFGAMALITAPVLPASILFGSIALGLTVADMIWGFDGDACNTSEAARDAKQSRKNK